jgi:hypothetical protein
VKALRDSSIPQTEHPLAHADAWAPTLLAPAPDA